MLYFKCMFRGSNDKWDMLYACKCSSKSFHSANSIIVLLYFSLKTELTTVIAGYYELVVIVEID